MAPESPTDVPGVRHPVPKPEELMKGRVMEKDVIDNDPLAGEDGELQAGMIWINIPIGNTGD
ncbi:hypothetical protein GCM10010252_30970 [Streptomyces aureoverticillatus]|nr:hypothetical protein GCM10010252_30970 [Streptomyces aureoverticillatus]